MRWSHRGAVTAWALVAAPLAASAQVPTGPQFVVNGWTTGMQYRPSVAPDGDGFVVAWSNQTWPVYEGFAQRFGVDGTRVGAEVRLDELGRAYRPVVAPTWEGGLLSVWDDGTGVVGRRHDPSGVPIGGEFQVAVYTTGYQDSSDVFRRRDGSFVVTWASQGVDGDMHGIVARSFAANGAPIGNEFVVNSFTTASQGIPAVDGDREGTFVIVWQDAGGQDGSGSGIFGQRFDRAGARLGAEFAVNTYTSGSQRYPSIDVVPDGSFVVAWVTGDWPRYTMAGRRFAASGAPIGAQIAVSDLAGLVELRARAGGVAADEAGNFVVVWMHGGDLRGQRIDAAGARRGSPFSFGMSSWPFYVPPVVAGDAHGNFAAVWDSWGDGDGAGILARRYGGLSPSALAVDPAGNGLLEPGESADVRPAWRNSSGAAQAIGGVLGGISGPAGMTFAIVDGTADYGTLPDAATGTCADCYAVSLSDPPVRPATHIDSTAVERITPDAQGQHKRWTFHVGRSFADVPSSHPSYVFAETLLHNGVTAGCRGGESALFCPDGQLTRGQTAPLVLLAKEGAGYEPPPCIGPRIFEDVSAANPNCRWIEELARRGVVTGCGPRGYCPNRTITRGEMAVVLVRTLDPGAAPPACVPPNLYDDVPETHAYCPWVEEAARRGMTANCGGGNYCPDARLTRGVMAEFLTLAFGLTLYGL